MASAKPLVELCSVFRACEFHPVAGLGIAPVILRAAFSTGWGSIRGRLPQA